MLSGECLEYRSQYLWVLWVCVCVIHTSLASGSCRKFFTCFLVEPHLPQAQTHIWTHTLEKISKPATHRGHQGRPTFQTDHKSNARRALCLAGYTAGSRRPKGSFVLGSFRSAWQTGGMAPKNWTHKSAKCDAGSKDKNQWKDSEFPSFY